MRYATMSEPARRPNVMMKFCTRLSRLRETWIEVRENVFLVIRISLTNDLVLKSLIFTDCFPISFTFVVLTVEVLDGLIVKQAIGMNTTSDLMGDQILDRREMKQTYHIAIVHLTPDTSAISCQNNTSNN